MLCLEGEMAAKGTFSSCVRGKKRGSLSEKKWLKPILNAAEIAGQKIFHPLPALSEKVFLLLISDAADHAA